MYILVLLFVAMASVFMMMAIKAGKKSNMPRLKKLVKLSTSMVGLSSLAVILNTVAMAAAEVSKTGFTDNSIAFLSAALSTGIATCGAGYAVGVSSSAAIGAISENEKISGKALIFVAMGEGIALYGVLIAFMILTKI